MMTYGRQMNCGRSWACHHCACDTDVCVLLNQDVFLNWVTDKNMFIKISVKTYLVVIMFDPDRVGMDVTQKS